MSSNETNTATATEAPNGKRKRLLLALSTAFASAGIAYGAWWGLAGRYVEHTDDAYVAGNVVQITPQTAGTVLSIHADDTDFVRAGQALVDLDEADAKVALDQAEAQLAQTVCEVRTLFATNDSLAASVNLREADVAKAREDLKRREALAGTGAVSGEELGHARTALAARGRRGRRPRAARLQPRADRSHHGGAAPQRGPRRRPSAGGLARLRARLHPRAGHRLCRQAGGAGGAAG